MDVQLGSKYTSATVELLHIMQFKIKIVHLKRIRPFQPSVAFHIETNHLFSSAKQVTGFYMKCNTGMK